MTTRPWSRSETLVALNLYCQIPFGRMHSRDPEIVRWAGLIDRTPSALAMKLTNFASLDPAITSTGRRGLSNVSSTDRSMWDEMMADWPAFSVEAAQAAAALGVPIEGDDNPAGNDQDYSAVERTAEVFVRVGQSLFRRTVLTAYANRCCVSGLEVPALLVASHIVPWRADPTNRLNPRNGLCLSVLHDRCFDAGILSIAADMTVLVASSYRDTHDQFFRSTVSVYEGHAIELPQAFAPDPGLLEYHRSSIFRG